MHPRIARKWPGGFVTGNKRFFIRAVERPSPMPGKIEDLLTRFAGFEKIEEPPNAIGLAPLNHLHRRRAVERRIGFFQPAAHIFWFHQAREAIEQPIHFDEGASDRSGR